MRARERVVEPPAPPESGSPAPEPSTFGPLSSIIINHPVSSGGSHVDPIHSADNRRRDSSPPLRRRDSPQYLHRREFLAPCQPDLRSPLILHRRRSPPASHPRSQRFRYGSICTPCRPRVNDGFNESDFHHPGGLRSGREMQRGRGCSRSPPNLGRVSRPYLRGSNSSVRAISPSEGEYVHRNDPNLSPREGDWICLYPSCGNLNFAQQTHCKNCHKNQYDNPCGSSCSTRRGYVNPPPPIDHGPQGNLIRYRSPPDDPRDSRTGLIPPRHRGKFLDTGRSNRLQFREDDFRESERSDRHVSSDWERRRSGDEFVSNIREFDCHHLSPDNQWIRDNRDRSRSPVSGGLRRNSFPGCS